MEQEILDEIRAYVEESKTDGVAMELVLGDTELYLRRYATTNDKPELYSLTDEMRSQVVTIISEVYQPNATEEEATVTG